MSAPFPAACVVALLGVWVSWCGRPDLNRRFWIDLCVGHMVRPLEFEASSFVVFGIVCTYESPNTKEPLISIAPTATGAEIIPLTH
jgi:hypothetical protein